MLMTQPAIGNGIVRSMTVVTFLLLLAVPQAFPQSRGGGRRSGPGTGDPYERLVPWRFASTGAPIVKATLALYWLPMSVDESEHSPLLTSQELVQASDRCLEFAIVLPADEATISKLGESGKLPAALLLDGHGDVIRRVDGIHGRLFAPAVEKMVRDVLRDRDETMYQTMTDARKRAASGDKDGAIGLYRKLWDERCLFPLAGEQAQHALKDLGVIVVEPPPAKLIDPNLPAPALPKDPQKPPKTHTNGPARTET
jgi:hypothetical protein